MNSLMCSSTGIAAGLAFALGLLGATPVAGGEPVTDFAKTELGVDLDRYAFGAPPSAFPELLPPDTTGAPQWRRAPLQRAKSAETNVTASLDLLFEGDRLVELRTLVTDFSTAGKGRETERLFAAFKRLGATAKKNSDRFVFKTPARTITAQGHCSLSNLVMLQFHVYPSSRPPVTP